MVTDGLTPFTLLGFLGAVLGGGVLVAAYAFARITGRPSLAKLTLILGAGSAAAYLLLPSLALLGPEWLIRTSFARTVSALAPLAAAAIAIRLAPRPGISRGVGA